MEVVVQEVSFGVKNTPLVQNAMELWENCDFSTSKTGKNTNSSIFFHLTPSSTLHLSEIRFELNGIKFH